MLVWSPPYRKLYDAATATPALRRLWAYAFLLLAVAAYYHPILAHYSDGLRWSLDTDVETFILEQVYQNILHGRSWYYGQNFFPYPHTITFAASLFTYQILYIPLRTVGLNPQQSFNILFILCILLQAAIVYEWTLHCIRRHAMAVTNALFCIGLAVPMYYMTGHFQLVSAYWYLVGFLLLDLWLRNRRWIYFVLLLGLVDVMFLADPATAIMAYLILGLYALTKLQGLIAVLRSPRTAAAVVLLTAVAGGLLVASALPYLDVAKQFGLRSPEEVATYSTRFASLLIAPSYSTFHKTLFSFWGLHEAVHLNGFLFDLLVALGGLLTFWSARRHRALVFCLIVAYLVSFGPWFRFAQEPGVVNPLYTVASLILPGFRAARGLGRYGLLLLPLAGFLGVYALAWIAGKARGGTGRSVVVYGVLTAVVLLEGLAFVEIAPDHVRSTMMRSFDYEQETRPFTQWNQVIAPGEAAVKLPYEPWPPFTGRLTVYQIGVLRTGARIVNGYSGTYPEVALHTAGLAREAASPQGVQALADYLRSIGVQWLVLETAHLPKAQLEVVLSTLAALPQRRTADFIYLRL